MRKQVVRAGCLAGLAIGVWLGGSMTAAAVESAAPEGKTPSDRNLSEIRNTVESLRGKKFLRPVPAFNISQKELEKLVDSELDKDYPGVELAEYEELLGWIGAVPPGTELKDAYNKFMVDQVAGMYDSDTKEMLIPAFTNAAKTGARKSAQKRLEKLSDFDSCIVFAHEFTHALEDQYWPLDDPKVRGSKASTDTGNAHSFLAEGSATRLMLESIPAISDLESPGEYAALWNLIHSGAGETVFSAVLADVWRSDDVKVEGVPDSLCRLEAMPYAYGYVFCSRIMRDWGLDGLDYIYNHRPVSSEQVMHPVKCWEWRDFPVDIALPEKLGEGWERRASDSAGEAGLAAFFSETMSFSRSSALAEGWDGDRVGLYQLPNNHRLMVWASAWDDDWRAQRFARAFAKERKKASHARIERAGDGWSWDRPDRRWGRAIVSGHYVILLESDWQEALANPGAITKTITFSEPPEDARRAEQQHAWLHYNPLFSWHKDGDYTVSKSLCGVLSRHDRNEIGAADRFVLGLGETRRTESFHKWELGWGGLAKHQSDTRRKMTKTTVLPFGLLVSHFATMLPQRPDYQISRSSVLWGFAASRSRTTPGGGTLSLLPFGALYHQVDGPKVNSVYILGTGYSHDRSGAKDKQRVRVLGIPVWSKTK